MVVKKYKICPKCGNWKFGSIICSSCGTERIESDITTEDYKTLSAEEFDNKIKEYIKSTYDPELAKERKSKERPVFADYVPNNVVICPYCKSNNTKKITNTSKAAHTALFGVFSMGRNSKNYHCNNCNSDF